MQNQRYFSTAAFSIVILIAIVWQTQVCSGHQRTDSLSPAISKLFESHCYRCHGGEETEGDVNLKAHDNPHLLSSNLDLLSDVIRVLKNETMPPEDASTLPAKTRSSAIKSLQVLLDDAVQSAAQLPKTPIRRMNRFQYNNAVQDLLELKVDVFALPERIAREYGNYYQPANGKMPANLKVGCRPLGKSQLINARLQGVAPFPQDLRAENGFDNRADHLSLSPLLMESFLKLGRSIVESRDFEKSTVGIWPTFFASPTTTGDKEKLKAEIHARVEPFLRRAFRRNVSSEIVDRYAMFAVNQIQSGASFEDAMKLVTSAVISSPRFLYLYDTVKDETSESRLDHEYALASKLSFFLWGSLPDVELIDLAARGELSNPKELALQVDRMLNDVRSKRFCDSFPSQWLQLERIVSSVPSPDLYPEFYFAKYRVSMHMVLEPLLVFETILVEDRPIAELIDSDFSYRSDLLKAWYSDKKQPSRKPPTTIPFSRVPIQDRRQGGVITTAAVMTMTSGPDETKPITRGAWMAGVILNDPPEPPPADVPPLPKASKADLEKLTIRERFASHRERTDCAACHRQLDPLGFAFENYDPVGLWRQKYENGREIDASGSLPGNVSFKDVAELKDTLLSKPEVFARAFAKHLLSFAIGREVTPLDKPSVDSIVKQTKSGEYRLRDLIRRVAMSDSFIGKRSSQTQP